MTYGKEIRERSLVPTTGDRWPSLLEYFYDSYQTNGTEIEFNMYIYLTKRHYN